MQRVIYAILLSFALAVPGLAQGYTPPGGGTLTAGQQNGAFGGNGSGGALTLSATESTVIQYNGTTVSVADGATETLKTGSVINATSTITIGGGASGVLTVAALSVGTAGGAATAGGANGNCPFAVTTGIAVTNRQMFGTSGQYNLSGGGGGGGSFWSGSTQGGAGGGGGTGGSSLQGIGSSGTFNGSIVPMLVTGGTGGSAAGGAGSSNAASLSGVNSGKLTICAVGAITVASGGSLNVNGGAGTASVTPDATSHGGGGAGGGAAGVAYIYSLASITATGTISANGGSGGNGGAAKGATNGNGGGGGGGGGAGVVLRMSPSNGGAGTYQAIGGAGGGAGAKDGSGTIGVAGTSNTGATGVALSITGTPNFPLIAMHHKYLVGSFGQLVAARAINGTCYQGMTEHCSLMAALECQQRGLSNIAFQQMAHHFRTNTEWVPDNAVAILNEPAKVQTTLDEFTCETLGNPEHGLYCGGLDECFEPAA